MGTGIADGTGSRGSAGERTGGDGQAGTGRPLTGRSPAPYTSIDTSRQWRRPVLSTDDNNRWRRTYPAGTVAREGRGMSSLAQNCQECQDCRNCQKWGSAPLLIFATLALLALLAMPVAPRIRRLGVATLLILAILALSALLAMPWSPRVSHPGGHPVDGYEQGAAELDDLGLVLRAGLLDPLPAPPEPAEQFDLDEVDRVHVRVSHVD
ncbi:hypothetical protein BH24ACI4_BH24ACI4_09340 [soil metagenome]